MMTDKFRLLRVNLYCTEADFKAVRNIDFSVLEDRLKLYISYDHQGSNAIVSVRVIPVLSSTTTCDIYFTPYDESGDLLGKTTISEDIVRIVQGSLSLIRIQVISVEQIDSPCFIGLDR